MAYTKLYQRLSARKVVLLTQLPASNKYKYLYVYKLDLKIYNSCLFVSTLMTSQGSDTVTSIFKCYSYNTIKSLRLLKIAQFS